MKKLFAVLAVFAMALALSGVSASAFGYGGGYGNWYHPQPQPLTLKLVAKDPVTWSETPQNGVATLRTGAFGYGFSVIGFGLEESQHYTLIYYGDASHNDEWPYATCIAHGRTGPYGRTMFFGFHNFNKYKNNGVDEKIWLVKSSDVDCSAKVMTAWHPEEYLFEHSTI